MAEVIGVAAAASQLAVSCFAILELMKKIKEAPSALKCYRTQLQELHDLSNSISLNPLLQTTEIGVQTRSLQEIVDQHNIEATLSRSRLFQSFVFLRKERDLKNTLDILERRKSQLSLIIHNIEASTLHQIQSDIHAMANRSLRNTKKSLLPDLEDDAAEFERQAGASSSSTSGASVALVKNAHRSRDWEPASVLHDYHCNLAKEAEKRCDVGPNQAHPLPTSNRSSSENWPHQGFPIGIEVNMKGRTVYRDCTAGEGVTQVNGAYIENDPDLLNRMAMQPSGHHFNYDNIGHANSPASSCITQTPSSTDNALLYINCTKSGAGDQHNNLDATYDGDVYGTPSMHAYYFGCALLPSQGQGQTSTGQRQINGPSLRRQKKTNAEDS